MSLLTCPTCGERFDGDEAAESLLFRAAVCPACREAVPLPLTW